MKTNKLLSLCAVSLAAIAMLFSSCKEEVKELKLNQANLALEVVETYTLKATYGETTLTADQVTWTSSDETIATVAAGVVTGVAEGSATITAAYDGKTATCAVTVSVPAAEKEEAPVLDAPEAGFVRLAVRVPAGTCNGVRGVGDFNSWNANDATQAFTKVEGKESWYYIDLDLAVATQVKVVSVSDAGASDWATQWGRNTDEAENVTFVTNPDEAIFYFELENDTEPKLWISGADAAAAYNVYIDINEWQTAPCIERNAAGTANFTMTTSVALPEGTLVGIVGSFADANWDIANPVLMTLTDGVYTATEIEVPAGFQYKYFFQLPDMEAFDWDHGCSGNNINMALDLNANDVIESWAGYTPEETPAE